MILRPAGLPCGRPVELIAYTDGYDWWLFHAFAPPTPGFRREYVENGGVV